MNLVVLYLIVATAGTLIGWAITVPVHRYKELRPLTPRDVATEVGTPENPGAVIRASYRQARCGDCHHVCTWRDVVPVLIDYERRAREFLADEADPVEKAMIEYLAIVADNVSPLPPPPPKGAGEIEQMLLRMYPELTFERLSVADAASQFYGSAESILRRS